MSNMLGWSDVRLKGSESWYGLVSHWGSKRFEIRGMEETGRAFPSRCLRRTRLTGLFAGKGLEVWVTNGLVHRPDGPAMDCDGELRWFLEGREYSFEEYWERQKYTPHASQLLPFVPI